VLKAPALNNIVIAKGEIILTNAAQTVLRVIDSMIMPMNKDFTILRFRFILTIFFLFVSKYFQEII